MGKSTSRRPPQASIQICLMVCLSRHVFGQNIVNSRGEIRYRQRVQSSKNSMSKATNYKFREKLEHIGTFQ